MGNCIVCGKEHQWSRNSVGLYCSNTCQGKKRTDDAITEWLNTGVAPKHSRVIKNYLLSIKHECWECGIIEWNGKPITLELDHVDGDGFNHHIDNLRLLCPNCHSQTDTYRNRNKGNGRVCRRERAKRDYNRP